MRRREEIAELLEVREMIEPHLAQRAARNITPDEIRRNGGRSCPPEAKICAGETAE